MRKQIRYRSISLTRTRALDETAAHIGHSAGVRALLSRHGLTAHTFVLGEYALLSAEFAVDYAGEPNVDASMANPANIVL